MSRRSSSARAAESPPRGGRVLEGVEQQVHDRRCEQVWVGVNDSDLEFLHTDRRVFDRDLQHCLADIAVVMDDSLRG